VSVARITIRCSERESGSGAGAGKDRRVFRRGQTWRSLYTAAETCGSRAPESCVTPGGQHSLGESYEGTFCGGVGGGLLPMPFSKRMVSRITSPLIFKLSTLSLSTVSCVVW